jgi:hypothetical protein
MMEEGSFPIFCASGDGNGGERAEKEGRKEEGKGKKERGEERIHSRIPSAEQSKITSVIDIL